MIIYNFIKYLILYIKQRRILNKIYTTEDIITNFTSIFSFRDTVFRVRKDWRNGLYVLLNPLAIPKEYLIFDADETLKTFIDKFIYDRMVAAETMIVNKQLFELLEPFEIRKYDDNWNYLAVSVPTAWKPFWKWTRLMLIPLTVIIVAVILLAVL